MSRRTIVVVEDEAAIAGAIAARLRHEGYAVEVAGSGPDGVALCARVAPDLVLLDWAPAASATATTPARASSSSWSSPR